MPQLASVVKQHFWKSVQSLQFPWSELRWSGLCSKHFLPSVPTWHLSFPYYRNIQIILTSSWWLSYEIRKENVIPHFMRKQKTIFRFISKPINSGPCGSLVSLPQISLLVSSSVVVNPWVHSIYTDTSAELKAYSHHSPFPQH